MYKNNMHISPLDSEGGRPMAPRTEKTGQTSVLVVDDDREILKILSEILIWHGFEVTLVDNGFEALNLLDEKNFRFVITDFQMPGINGLVLASTVKKRYPKTGVILMSGIDRRDLEREQGFDCIDAFMPKPFSMGTLLNSIGTVI